MIIKRHAVAYVHKHPKFRLMQPKYIYRDPAIRIDLGNNMITL